VIANGAVFVMTIEHPTPDEVLALAFAKYQGCECVNKNFVSLRKEELLRMLQEWRSPPTRKTLISDDADELCRRLEAEGMVSMRHTFKCMYLQIETVGRRAPIHGMESVDASELTLKAIRERSTAFNHWFTRNGGYKGYEAQAIDALLDCIDKQSLPPKAPRPLVTDIVDLIRNDSYAVTFQSMGEYRSALVRHAAQMLLEFESQQSVETRDSHE
jgi:hypothetical protein